MLIKPEELAAYIGAAAWLPQIAAWIYRAIVKPKLRVVPDQFAQVGFTSYGPIFNVRMAFFVENRDLIIDGIELNVTHEDGEGRVFRWAGLGETFSEITDAAGNKQIVSKDQTPIAVKVVVQAFLERFVRFQEPRFHEVDAVATRALVGQFNFLKQKSSDSFVPEALASRDFFAVIDERQKGFHWKPGQYDVSLKPSSPQKFNLVDATFSFELSAEDIEHLRKNLLVIDTELRNVISSNLQDYTQMPVHWQWANVPMQRGKRSNSLIKN
jgi:hypothetical protein